MQLRLLLAGLLATTLVACAADTDPPPSAEDSSDVTSAKAPPNFLTVRPGLYRGGHPDAAGMAYLEQRGVRRILDLEVGDFIEAFPWTIDKELHDAEARGIQVIRYPMSAFEPALSDRFDRNIDEMMVLLASATPADPIYVHCKHGQDRTGLVIGLERVIDEGWQPKDAHDEMVRIGFHTGFIGLEEYFERKTGWEN